MAIAHAILGSEDACPEMRTSCPAAARSEGKDDDVQKVVLDVPEIDTQEVLGEWLVPRGEVLLVSFGAHTVAGKDGMAVVKERLAMIEADEADSGRADRTEVDEPGARPDLHSAGIWTSWFLRP